MLQKTKSSKEKSTDAEIEEEIILAWNKVYSDSYLNGLTAEQKAKALKDELGNNAELKSDNVTVEYRGKTIVITQAGEMKIKQPMKTITAGEKAPDDENAKYVSGNYTAIIPAGFTISNQPGESSIKTGLVIRDDAGNEFVWIPVGIPWKSDATETIRLGRYVFDSNGDVDATLSKSNPQDQLKTSASDSKYYTEGLKESTTDNTHANDIEDFIAKTNVAGGFWIGRYEARTTVTTARASVEDVLTAVTEKPENSVYNYINQADASTKAREMYSTNNYFESDLINSYAWDTATLFLQEYDDRIGYNLNKYSIQHSINLGGANPLATGTVSETKKDKICNVYDMASNCVEWSTETCNGSGNPFVRRGGNFNDSSSITSTRSESNTNVGNKFRTFRPILYVK